MTLSMGQSEIINATKAIDAYINTAKPNTGNDFQAIMQMLLSTTMSPLSNSDSSSSLQNLLFSLSPLLQNISINSAAGKAPVGMPVQGGLTQEYHASHHGLDFGVAVGTNVKSTMSGVVKYAGWNDEGYGNLVIVDNGAYQTYYGHLDKIPVRAGDSVYAGQVIGSSGNTGNSTGPHLHYEVRADGKPINPTTYVYGRVSQFMV
jgi:murein DD-endopeptidase MepM/ murein hydrolase activator NlpD